MAQDNADYTVAWISALPDERASAEALLDKEHDDLPLIEGDNNSYTLGKMGQHNVVIAGMPVGTTGTTSASTVAANLLRSFPNIRFGLLVGVGGGVPDSPDLRLGDVVVSIPEGTNGGVIQYDFGTAVQDKKFIEKGSLNKPPAVLTTALGKLRSKAARLGYTCWRHYDDMLKRYPKMKPKFERPEKDDLYKADYIHGGSMVDCAGCSPKELVSRSERPEKEPSIFYGTIGSANQVLRDAKIRDEMYRQSGIICFEMEAAGLMDNFPCIVIRGISDYADTHKNKEWQPYAGAVAAAFAKELVLSVAPSLVGTLPQANLILTEISKKLDRQDEYFRSNDVKVVLDKLPSVRGAAYNSFTDISEEDSYCLKGTRLDLLDQIRQWAITSNKHVFWLNGMAGTGKSTIARTIAAEFDKEQQLGASFFFRSGQGDLSRASSFVSTIVNHLVQSIPELRLLVSGVLDDNPDIVNQTLRLQFEQLILRPLQAVTNPSRSFYVMVIDALDECDNEEHVKTIVSLLSQVQSVKIQVKTIVTSRPELPIKLGFRMISKDTYQGFTLQEIEKSIIGHDITLFLRHRFKRIRAEWSEPSFCILPVDWPGEDNIKILAAMAVPLFIFATTVCRFIGDRFSNPQENLSFVLRYRNKAGLDQMDQTYKPILDRLLDSVTKRNGMQQESIISKFRDVVGPIVVLAGYLSIEALTNLLQTPSSDMYTLLRHLHSVLDNVDYLDRPIRPIHLSFPNYLLDSRRQNQFSIDETATHKYMACRCIQLLRRSKNLKQDICDFKKPGILRSEIKQSTLSRCIPTELQYACCYWVYHLEKGHCEITYNDEFHLFLNERFLWWLEALSLIGKIFTALEMISTLQTLLDKKDNSQLISFLLDAQRFIQASCSIADVAPLQLYYSSIVFAPQQSFIRSRYSLPKWLIQCLPIKETWGTIQTLELQTLERDTDSIESVVFSPSGKTLVISSDTTIKIWDAKTGILRKTLQEHLEGVILTIFSPDEKHLVSSSYDETLRMWDASTGLLIQVIQLATIAVSIAFSLDEKQLICACSDHTVRIIDAETMIVQQTLEGRRCHVGSVVFSPDRKQLAYSDDEGVRICDIGTESVKIFESSPQWAIGTTFSPDGRLLASGSGKTIIVWNIDDGSTQQILETVHPYDVLSIAFSPDGKQLASALVNGRLEMWGTDTWTVQSTKEYPRGILSVAFSPDGERLASASTDGIVRIADPRVTQQVFEGHSESVESLSFSHDGKLLISYSFDETIKIWDVSTGSLLHTLEERSGLSGSPVFSSDGKQLAYHCNCKTIIKIWDIETENFKQAKEESSSFMKSIAFSRNGEWLASFLGNGRVNIWDMSTGSLKFICQREADWPILEGVLFDDFSYQDIHRGSTGVWESQSWIMHGDEKIIWLAPEYKATATASFERIYVLGLASGRVIFFTFSFEVTDTNDSGRSWRQRLQRQQESQQWQRNHFLNRKASNLET